jgi:hypothetical protein
MIHLKRLIKGLFVLGLIALAIFLLSKFTLVFMCSLASLCLLGFAYSIGNELDKN